MPAVDVRKMEARVFAEYEEPSAQVEAEGGVGGGSAPAPPPMPTTPLPAPAQVLAYASSGRGERSGPMGHIKNEWNDVTRRMKAIMMHWRKMYGIEK